MLDKDKRFCFYFSIMYKLGANINCNRQAIPVLLVYIYKMNICKIAKVVEVFKTDLIYFKK